MANTQALEALAELRTEANSFSDMIKISTPNSRLEAHANKLDTLVKTFESALGYTPSIAAPTVASEQSAEQAAGHSFEQSAEQQAESTEPQEEAQ